MKIITLHKNIDLNSLHNHIQERLNPIFHQQRQMDVTFKIEKAGNSVKISQPQLYKGILFDIEVRGDELWITRSEHYVDDINSITIESILNSLFDDLSGKQGTDLVQEG